jgi:hypothetical protein
MQALTPLLIELSLDCVHLTVDKSHVTSCVDKLISWLNSMKTVDAVSESAYNVVTRVLNRQSSEEAAQRQMPHPEPTTQGQSQQEYGIMQQMPDSQHAYQMQSQPPHFQGTEHPWSSSDAFNTMSHLWQPDAGNSYRQSIPSSEYLTDPNVGGLHDFGQPQMSLFYGNPYTATMDQWDWDSLAVDDTVPGHGQQQHQGQNYGSGPSQ